MINVTLYNFNKRENSTKQPGRDSQQKTHQAALKDSCSLLHPRLVFDFGELGNPSYYNYCYISDLGGKYYFIRDWEYERGFWTAYCDVDVLATWRNAIGISKQYVLRSSATYDGNVIDNFYPAKQGATAKTTTVASPFVREIANGRYIVGIINSDASGIGAVHYYIFTQAQFNSLCEYLMSGISWTNVTEITEDLEKVLFNPFQYIVSCTWIPFVPSTVGEALSSVPYGWWEISGVSCNRISRQPYSRLDTLSISISKHPQAARGNYLNGAPYSFYELIVPAFGTISLDSGYMAKLSDLYLAIHVDLVTGAGRLQIMDATDGNIFRTVYAQVGVPIQLAQMATNVGAGLTAIGSAIGGIAGLATGNFFGAAIGGLSAIGNAARADRPNTDTQGRNGGFEEFSENSIKLVGMFYNVVDEDNDDRGRPLCQKKELYTIPGYILTLDADINFAGTKDELQQVKQYMESGFFYE